MDTKNGTPLHIPGNAAIVSEWKYLTAMQKQMVIDSTTQQMKQRNLKINFHQVQKIIEQVKPKVWVGFENRKPFMRVHEDSIGELIKRLTDKLL